MLMTGKPCAGAYGSSLSVLCSQFFWKSKTASQTSSLLERATNDKSKIYSGNVNIVNELIDQADTLINTHVYNKKKLCPF